ncbi:MAG: ATP-binding protein, partial [Chloroflexota bacterium]|nr:ATP-binding protein [Chloroflexota bacterium]
MWNNSYVEAAFAEAVRELVVSLATGGEAAVPSGGGLARVFRETGATSGRAALEVLADRWFRAVPRQVRVDADEPLLNRSDLGESEKLHLTIREHVVGQRRWQELCSNESTFYRYRRAAIAALADRLWLEVAERRLPSNRPQPEYVRCVGREGEVATLLRWLSEPGGTVVGVEGPGGCGKTALLHAVADACEAAAHAWRPLPIVPGEGPPRPVFDALVWVACADGSGLATLLEAVARTLDYPGLLARGLEDRRQAVRDLLSRRGVLLLVDDLDRADPAMLTFLADLPGRSRALVSGRR